MELLQDATPDNLRPNLLAYVKSRLAGWARTAAGSGTKLKEIILLLRSEIVHESSESIESKLVALISEGVSNAATVMEFTQLQTPSVQFELNTYKSEIETQPIAP